MHASNLEYRDRSRIRDLCKIEARIASHLEEKPFTGKSHCPQLVAPPRTPDGLAMSSIGADNQAQQSEEEVVGPSAVHLLGFGDFGWGGNACDMGYPPTRYLHGSNEPNPIPHALTGNLARPYYSVEHETPLQFPQLLLKALGCSCPAAHPGSPLCHGESRSRSWRKQQKSESLFDSNLWLLCVSASCFRGWEQIRSECRTGVVANC